MTYKMTTIGKMPQSNGSDEYVIIRNMDDDIDLDHAEEYLLQSSYNEGSGPGSYFCTSVRIIADPIHSDRCIGIINHRFDI